MVGPHWKQYMQELSERSFNQFDTMIVGEAAGIDFGRACEITREGAGLLDMLFHFEHVGARAVCAYNQKTTDLRRWKRILFRWQELPEHSWGALYYENHDQARSLPRFAPAGAHRAAAAKSLAVSLLFQKGTPFIYQGQELGMTNCPFTSADYRDIQSVNQLEEARKKPFGKIVAHFTETYLQRYARDNARTPMQWSDAANAGFTSGTPGDQCRRTAARFQFRIPFLSKGIGTAQKICRRRARWRICAHRRAGESGVCFCPAARRPAAFGCMQPVAEAGAFQNPCGALHGRRTAFAEQCGHSARACRNNSPCALCQHGVGIVHGLIGERGEDSHADVAQP